MNSEIKNIKEKIKEHLNQFDEMINLLNKFETKNALNEVDFDGIITNLNILWETLQTMIIVLETQLNNKEE